MVRKNNGIDVGREEAFVACRARARLETFAAPALEPQAMRRERHVTQYALRGAELRPATGVGRKPVVDVDGGERDWMPRDEGGHGIEEDHRIHAAR